jgi:tRNA G18 (ribose-2'-O)-methylase SpoU
MKKLSSEELKRSSPEEFKNFTKRKAVLVLDNIRSLNNVGSAFRTADAFALELVALCGITGTPPHRDINKTAIGAQDTVEWTHYASTTEAVEELKSQGYKIIAVEQTNQSTMLHDFRFEKDQPYAFILGNEVMGVSDDVLPLVDDAIEIPQFGTKHSFNVTISAGIVLWDYVKSTL